MNMIIHTFDGLENTGVLTANDSTAVTAAVKDASKIYRAICQQTFFILSLLMFR